MKQSRKGPFLFENEWQEVGATNTADVSAARPSTRHKEKLRAIAAANADPSCIHMVGSGMYPLAMDESELQQRMALGTQSGLTS
jgi:hypothetical protein